MEKWRIGAISFYKGVQSRGVWKTFEMLFTALKDEKLDAQMGISAAHFVDPKRELPHHQSTAAANYYQPIRTIPFRKLLRTLQPDTQQVFVDIGCGAGKALFLAAEYGFEKVKGIEYVPSLVQETQDNIRQWSNAIPKSQMTVFELDSKDYFPSDDENFFLLNDPFDNSLFEDFVDKVLDKVKRGQSPVVVYKNNNDRKMPALDRLAQKLPREDLEFGGNYFEVYRLRK